MKILRIFNHASKASVRFNPKKTLKQIKEDQIIGADSYSRREKNGGCELTGLFKEGVKRFFGSFHCDVNRFPKDESQDEEKDITYRIEGTFNCLVDGK